MKSEHYSTAQRKKTATYAEKQCAQLYTTFPTELIHLWGIETGQIVVWRPNGNGKFILKKTNSKPQHSRMTYDEWLAKLRPHTPHIPTQRPG